MLRRFISIFIVSTGLSSQRCFALRFVRSFLETVTCDFRLHFIIIIIVIILRKYWKGKKMLWLFVIFRLFLCRNCRRLFAGFAWICMCVWKRIHRNKFLYFFYSAVTFFSLFYNLRPSSILAMPLFFNRPRAWFFIISTLLVLVLAINDEQINKYLHNTYY